MVRPGQLQEYHRVPNRRRRKAASTTNINASNPVPSGESVGIAVTATTVAVLLLFAVFGSGVLVAAVALLEIGPEVAGRFSARVMVAELPLAIVPTEQITVVVPLQLP